MILLLITFCRRLNIFELYIIPQIKLPPSRLEICAILYFVPRYSSIITYCNIKISQLVNGRRPTGNVLLPQNILISWDQFKNKNPSVIYENTLLAGASNYLTEACAEISTSYRNAIIETFETKVLPYLRYKLQTKFVVMI